MPLWPRPDWHTPNLENSPQPSHHQIADFILLSQKVNERPLSIGQLHLDVAWSAILVLDPENEGNTIGFNEHHASEHLAVSAWSTRLDISYPYLVGTVICELHHKARNRSCELWQPIWHDSSIVSPNQPESVADGGQRQESTGHCHLH
ncbi:hypothetical protein [Pseudomonas syringae]|nr:hypothetical protein [Pseudomonas syringae]